MGFLRNLYEQLRTYWNQTGGAARAGLVAAVVVCAAAIAGVGYWSSRPQYVTIASSLSPTDAAEIVSKLEGGNISSRMNFSGSEVQVPKTQWNKARLLLGDLASPYPSDVGMPSESIFDDPSLNHFKLLRQQEQKLARTIMQIAGVQHATVHISQPEPSPFVRDMQPTTASVVLQMRRGAIFSREQAASVVAMMANSVEGLQPESITVMDTAGRTLSAGGSNDADINGQLEYRQTLEANLATKAEMMLAEALGRGRAVVRVSADLDFRKSQRTETTYDPDAKVKTSEKIRSTQITGAGQTPLGAAGTPSNVGNATPNPGSEKPFSEKTEENETTYETTRIEDVIHEPSGTIKRLTVAALVDLSPDEAAPADGAAPADAPSPVITKEQVEAIVKQAVGFDLARNDQIEVLVTKLVGATPLDPLAGDGVPTWQYVNQMIRNLSLGLASLVAIVVTWMVLRKVRPLPIPADRRAAVTADRAKRVSDLAEQATSHPDALAKVVAAWLGETPGAGETTGDTDAADARVRRIAAAPQAVQPRRVARAA